MEREAWKWRWGTPTGSPTLPIARKKDHPLPWEQVRAEAEVQRGSPPLSGLGPSALKGAEQSSWQLDVSW